MKREDLKEFNLSDEQVQKIMDLHDADLERQKQSITTLTAERDAAREQVLGELLDDDGDTGEASIAHAREMLAEAGTF